VLQAEFARCRAARRVEVTLELREMPRALYFKAGPPPRVS
jgi:5-carboxymethyl-2-hydroxymuconate isomerase